MVKPDADAIAAAEKRIREGMEKRKAERENKRAGADAVALGAGDESMFIDMERETMMNLELKAMEGVLKRARDVTLHGGGRGMEYDPAKLGFGFDRGRKREDEEDKGKEITHDAEFMSITELTRRISASAASIRPVEKPPEEKIEKAVIDAGIKNVEKLR